MAAKASKAVQATTKAPARKRAARPTGAPDRPVKAPGPSGPAAVAADVERGLHGVEVDETPNENYTVAGVTSGKPTPETTRVAGERVPVQALVDGKIVKK